jgi:uncharacterized protein YyaL (SSP411 family)
MAAVEWSTWSADAFARARAENKPVLLSIAVPWCASCREMDRTSYADPHIAARVNDRFVAIRVDADRRPDIGERYSLGGWPTTAFLTADGDLIGGGTYVAPDRMPEVLDRVVDALDERREEIAARAVAPIASDARQGTTSLTDDELLASVFGTFDPVHGGFGTEPKFPLTGAIDLALALYRDSNDADRAHIAQSTLDAMGWGGLYDDVDGGFFRYAATRDWQMPHVEKLLDVNALLLRVYIDASAALQLTRYRERAVDVLRYLQTWLADPVDGGWAGSQQAHRTYYEAQTPAARQLRQAPPVDRVLYAGWNAAMVSSALHAAQALDDPALGEFAMKSLERVLLACYRPGAGVAHYLDGEPAVRGLLDDQVAMAAASLDAYEATGNIVYEMMAEELAQYALRTMWDERHGGFFDRASPDEHERIGLMRQTLKPFVANCEAARVLRRIATSSGDHEFDDRASATLAAIAPRAAEQGPLAAHYLLALRTARG